MENPGDSSADAVTSKDEDSKMKEIVQKAQQSIIKCVKESNGLPKGGGSFELYASYPAFIQFMEEQEKRVLALLHRTLHSTGFRVKVPSQVDDLEEFFDTLVEANDRIFERVGILLDNVVRTKTEEGNVVPQIERGAESTFIKTPSRYSALLARSNPVLGSNVASNIASTSAVVIEKPQQRYSLPVDNSLSKFVWKLRVKHHALRDSNRLLITEGFEADSSRDWQNDQAEYAHPYQRELEHFMVPDCQLVPGSVTPFMSVEETTLVLINTPEKLEELRTTLNNVSEFAVDLEHHDYRSFLGLSCLMQISTRTTDYVIDPFPIWNEMGILNEPFTDPKILKVFHGADRDVLWLQRDFGIYIVNMFDTYFASEVLNFSRHNLSYLVSTLCDVTLDKTLQKSDWRTRPLNESQIDYARRDTHYLLHCYDRLRRRLLDSSNDMKNLLHYVYDKSKLICLKVFEKPTFESEGFELLVKKRLNSQQRFALSALYKWRDERARAEDESLNYVLPDHMLLKIAEVLPREFQGILACCYPVPPFVKQELHILHHIIHEARDQPLVKASQIAPNVAKLTFDSVLAQLSKMTKLKSLLKCHLDFSSTKFDESISKLAITEEEKKSFSIDFENEILDLSSGDLYEGEKFKIGTSALQKTVEDLGEKVEQVLSDLDQWATPYECYKIGLAQEEANEKNRQSIEYKELEAAGLGRKKLWTHHDPAREEGKQVETKSEVTGFAVEEPSTSGFVAFPEMIMTKKALKRKQQNEKKSATLQLAGPQGSSATKKSKQRNWTKAAEFTDRVVNYEKSDSKMFYEKPEGEEAYDPFRHNHKSSSRKGKSRLSRPLRDPSKSRGKSNVHGAFKRF